MPSGRFVKGGGSGVRVTGLGAMRRLLGRMITNAPKEFERALRLRAEGIMTVAKRDHVPVDKGPLRDSGWVGPVKRKGNNVSVELAFGGPAGSGNQGKTNDEDVGYAIPQHERKDYHHKVGGDKYLEKPLMEAVGTMARDLAKDLDLRRMKR